MPDRIDNDVRYDLLAVAALLRAAAETERDEALTNVRAARSILRRAEQALGGGGGRVSVQVVDPQGGHGYGNRIVWEGR